MIRSTSAALIALRRRGLLLGAVVGTVVASLLGTIVPLLGSSDGGPGAPTSEKTDYGLADGLQQLLGQASTLLGVVALVVCAAAVASMYSDGTLRNLLVRQPRRGRLLGGTVAAPVLLVTAATLGGAILAIGAALILGPGQGYDTSLWTSGDGHRDTLAGVGGLLLSGVGHGLVGAALGALLRSPAAAIGLGVAYLLPVETILRAAVPDIESDLPGMLLRGLVDGTTSAGGAAILAVLLAVLMAITTRRFQRADVAG